MKKRNNQKGFTIIELVVVILLLGILTATALPRFMDVTDDAHNSVVSAVVGGLATGSALYRAQWFAGGQPTNVTEFGGLNNNRNTGYPIGIKAGTPTQLRTVGSSENCQEIFQNLLQAGGAPGVGAVTAASSTLGQVVPGAAATGNDFVAYLISGGDSATLNVCNYIYVGQYSNNTLNSLPVITYNARTGAVTQSNH